VKTLNGIVCIVCFNRLEELKRSVESVQKANVLNQRIIVVCQRGNPDVEKYVNALNENEFIKIFTAERVSESVKSIINRNVHRAFEEAFSRKADYVVLIEDDIEIHNSFLKFVDSVQKIYLDDSKFRAVNGFCASPAIPQVLNGYGKFRFGVGWGWSINSKTWKKLKSNWNGSEDSHWDGLIEPYMRTGFVIMPNTSLIRNHGLNGEGSNSAEDPILAKAIDQSFKINNNFLDKEWTFNQLDVQWREDCFTYVNTNSFKGKMVDLLFKIAYIYRGKDEKSTEVNRIKATLKALIFRLIGKMV
jgi:hypothetical protein